MDILKSKEQSAILDVGSYIGHDLRALHWAGVPLSSLYGLDIISFANLGWELFNDHERFNIGKRLLVVDVLDESASSSMTGLLDGKMDVIWCSAVLRQFPGATAVRACKRLVRFSRGAQCVIFGAQVGSKEGEGKIDMKTITEQMAEDTKPFKHNASSFERMWKQVGEESGVDLEAKAIWKDWEEFGYEKERCKIMGPDIGVLEWNARIRRMQAVQMTVSSRHCMLCRVHEAGEKGPTVQGLVEAKSAAPDHSISHRRSQL